MGAWTCGSHDLNYVAAQAAGTTGTDGSGCWGSDRWREL